MKHPYNKEYFESGTISNYKGYHDSPHFKLLAKEIESIFAPKRVLEVGCSKGYIIKYLRKLGVDAYGIDISEYAIKNAPKEVKPFLKVCDAKEIKLQNKSFDLVFSVDLLEHFEKNDLSKVINEMLKLGKNQFHIITTIELIKRKDITHKTLEPILWWKEQFSKIKDKYNYQTNIILLLDSKDHWLNDFLKIHNENNTLKSIREELNELYSSRGWKILNFFHNLRKSIPFIKRL